MEIISQKDAKSQGLKRWFTGRPCRSGHIAERYTSCYSCVVCHKITRISWLKANFEKDKGDKKVYRAATREYMQVYCRDYYKANSAEIKASIKAYGWHKRNPGKRNALTAKRRGALLQRTPAWANLKQIARIYQLAAWASKFTDEVLHVDHIIPLQGRNISGLHVENNLQILRALENQSKFNHF